MHERGALQYQDHPEIGRIIVQQTPIRFDGIEPIAIPPSRKLGQDAVGVLQQYTQLTAEEIAVVAGVSSDSADATQKGAAA
ncbi:MAG: hypothetical protein BGP06_21685 [Rhizobiales bacterium 65-9]|nr:MAG: hypothetical protein BGP06_21685 [Rhizobiales bacterium 65-9]